MIPKTVAGRIEMIEELLNSSLLHNDEIKLILNFGKCKLSIDEFMTVELTPYLIEKYANAKKAYELKQTKLYKALK